MKLGIGTAVSESPVASTMGPAYEYSFSMDFSKMTTTNIDPGGDGNLSFPYFNQPTHYKDTDAATLLAGGDGFRLELKDVEDSMPLVGFPRSDGANDDQRSLISSEITSYSQDGIPDGSISTTYRYVSMVVTFHSTNKAGDSTANYNSTGYFGVEDTGGVIYGYSNFHGDKGSGADYPRHINGVDISDGFDDTVREKKSGMLKSGTSEFDKPMTFTWDMMDARSPALTGAINPAEFKFHQDGGQISITFHGFIFSSSVPGEVTLPIHTSRPVAAFA